MDRSLMKAEYCDLVMVLDGVRSLHLATWQCPTPAMLESYTVALCDALNRLSAYLLESSACDAIAVAHQSRRSLGAMKRQRDALWRANAALEPSAVLERGERLLRTMDAALAMLRIRPMLPGTTAPPSRFKAQLVPAPPPYASGPSSSAVPRFVHTRKSNVTGWDVVTR